MSTIRARNMFRIIVFIFALLLVTATQAKVKFKPKAKPPAPLIKYEAIARKGGFRWEGDGQGALEAYGLLVQQTNGMWISDGLERVNYFIITPKNKKQTCTMALVVSPAISKKIEDRDGKEGYLYKAIVLTTNKNKKGTKEQKRAWGYKFNVTNVFGVSVNKYYDAREVVVHAQEAAKGDLFYLQNKVDDEDYSPLINSIVDENYAYRCPVISKDIIRKTNEEHLIIGKDSKEVKQINMGQVRATKAASTMAKGWENIVKKAKKRAAKPSAIDRGNKITYLAYKLQALEAINEGCHSCYRK